MTWSIVALDGSGAFGVAVASRFFAVGALCPAVLARRGALSTQALINPLYARAGLALLAEGLAPATIIERLTGTDPGRDVRQLHLVDARGDSAAWTGSGCIEWCGHRTFPGFSVAGNMLTGPEVLEATAATYQAHPHRPFAERLIAAMQAGEAAGGDKRGKQAAALLIHTTEAYPVLDLRVDDHSEPLSELRRLYDVSLERFQPFMECLPREGDAAGITDRAVIEARVAAFHAARAMRTEKA